MDETTNNSNNFTWSNTSNTASTSDNIVFFTDGTYSVNPFNHVPKIIDNTWMPYRYCEYNPLWHKKYARYKLLMEHMWD